MGDQEPRRPFGAEPQEERVPGLSPVRAFFIVGALAAIVPLGLLATRSDEAPPEPGRVERSPDFSLTDAEAIVEFEELNDKLVLAYEQRDIALAESIFTSDSPMLPRVRKEITTLIRSARFSDTRFRPLSTVVMTNIADEVEINRIENVYPRFETARGEDATAAGRPHRQEVEWSLRVENGQWLLYDAVIVKVTKL